MVGGRRIIILILTLYLLIGTAFALIFPLGEAPDEPGHFAYMRFLSLNKKLPVLKPEEPAAAHHPPAYYTLIGALVSTFIEGNLHLYRNPLFDWGWKTPHFIRGPEHSFPWQGDHLAWYIARFVSLLLGLGTLLTIYIIGRHVFGSEMAAVACVAYAALNPQFIYLNSYVNNDLFATLAGTLLILAALIFYASPTFKNAVFSAITISLAALAKPTALALLPGLILALVLRWRHFRWKILAILGLIPVLLSGWWFLRNLKLYGDLIALSALRVALYPNYYAAPLSISELIRLLPLMFTQTFKSTWGYFGWLTLPLPDRLFSIILISHIAAALGLLAKSRNLVKEPRAWILGLSGLGLLFSFLQYNRIANSSGWQGRFLFPAISVMAIAFVDGWRYWFRGKDQILALLLTGAGVSLSLYALVGLILPVYQPPQFLSSEANIPNRMDVAFEGGLHLIGYELPIKKVKPGSPLKLALYWKIEDSTAPAYRVKITAYTFTGECVIPTVESFLMKRYPTPLWKQGMIVKDELHLKVERNIEQVVAPITVFVFQGLDLKPVQRLDKPDNKIELAWVAVGPKSGPRVNPEKQQEVSFGDGLIRLTGYAIQSEPIGASERITVTLYWRAEKPVEYDYQVFVHLLNERGELIAQHDGPPRLGLYPTSAWSPGEMVVDEHPITVPQNCTGKARLLTGLYSLETLERLTVKDWKGVEFPVRAVPLGEIDCHKVGKQLTAHHFAITIVACKNWLR